MSSAQTLMQLTAAGNAELAVDSDGKIAVTAGLETLCFVSLFTNRRAKPSQNASSLQGWWADTEDDEIGSWLWQLKREPFTTQAMRRGKLFSQQALQWMITDGIAKTIEVSVEAVTSDIMGIAVSIDKGLSSQWDGLWEVQRAKL